jgi:hypothetical protein
MKTPGEPGVGIETKTNDSPKRAKKCLLALLDQM